MIRFSSLYRCFIYYGYIHKAKNVINFINDDPNYMINKDNIISLRLKGDYDFGLYGIYKLTKCNKDEDNNILATAWTLTGYRINETDGGISKISLSDIEFKTFWKFWKTFGEIPIIDMDHPDMIKMFKKPEEKTKKEEKFDE